MGAEQEGICKPGEQLLVNPLGYGECGCTTDPPHLQWSDGLCYPVMTQGPCGQHQVFVVDDANVAPVCMPMECPENQIKYKGTCFELGERGPCSELETLEINLDNFKPY